MSFDEHVRNRLGALERAGTLRSPREVAGPQGAVCDVDGRRVVVDGGGVTGDLFLFDLATGVDERFTFDSGGDMWPIWSPDGTQIVFSSTRV